MRIAATLAICSAIVSIIHPDQFRAGLECHRKLYAYPHLRDELDAWPCIFNAISVIANRKCTPHRDPNTAFEVYDLLINLAPNSPTRNRDSTVELVSLGITATYRSGTVIAFSGKLILHTANDVEKERACYAFTMKDSILMAAEVRACGWMYHRIYNMHFRPVVVQGA